MTESIKQQGDCDHEEPIESPTDAETEDKNRRIMEHIQEEAPEVLGAVAIGMSFQGPLPPPEMLSQYDELVPGAAERLIDIHEKEKQHGSEIKKTMVEAEREDNSAARAEFKRGQIFSFIIVLGILGLAGYMTAKKAPTQAATVVTGTVVALVLAFLYGRTPIEREENQSE